MTTIDTTAEQIIDIASETLQRVQPWAFYERAGRFLVISHVRGRRDWQPKIVASAYKAGAVYSLQGHGNWSEFDAVAVDCSNDAAIANSVRTFARRILQESGL